MTQKRDSSDAPVSIETEHVFGDQRPFTQCHAATLVRVPGGRYLAAWFGGTRESHADVGIWAARRENQWSPPRKIAKVRNEAHWNPVLFALDETGESLVLHFKVGESIRHWETWMQTSRDAGETWSEAVPLETADGDAQGGRGAVRNKPIKLASGDWLAGASLERWRRWDAFFDRSPNGQDAWERTPLVPRDRVRFKGKGIIQPTLWESTPGNVHALFRSTDGAIHRSDSTDDGRTWSRSRAINLPNNNSGLDLARLPNGTLALACNPVPGNWAARSPLSILFSHDNGEHWPARIDIEIEAGEYSYPAMIADGEGLALAYTWNRRRIAFARIDARDVPRESDQLGKRGQTTLDRE